MNWDTIEGQWKQFKGSIREKWGKLTDDDIEQIAGNKDKFLGRLQERYGISRDQAERDLDAWRAHSIGTDTPRTRKSGGY
jgi:uncharacterized protein YjbJ (UPF0337 family)